MRGRALEAGPERPAAGGSVKSENSMARTKHERENMIRSGAGNERKKRERDREIKPKCFHRLKNKHWTRTTCTGMRGPA